MGKTKTKSAKAPEPDADDILGALGDVKVEDKKTSDTKSIKVLVDDKAVCAALRERAKYKKAMEDAEQKLKAAIQVIDPVAKQSHQDRSRLDKNVHKSVHLYDKESMVGATFVLGRFSPSTEASGKKVPAGKAALQEVFGEKFGEYFRVSAELKVKEDACTPETVKLLREKLGDDFNRLFTAVPAIGLVRVSEKDKMQVLMRDFVLDDAIQALVAKAAGLKLLKRGYDSIK